ncbi:GGDEF domain-containing protein [Sphingomonas adhaesiva]|uniref:GGDEF domain-containing protein n=1 Tax=Sphingomonas adhaesiva TaxID=28212 RepID=UPI002FF50225
MPSLDSATVHLCTVLASLSFGLLFVALWVLRERGTFYLLCGGAALTYAATLAGLNLPGRGLAFSTLLCVGIGAYNSYMLAALRLFEGKRATSPLVIAMPVLAGLSYLVFAVQPGGVPAGRVANSIVLGLSTLVVGVIFLRCRGARAPRSRRIIGVIQLAYVPSYIVSVTLDLAAVGQRDWLSLIPLLSDQVLLGVLNVALLSMPGERAEADLRDMALRDPLTGAWNRAGLDRIRAHVDRPLDVIVFDVDNFKQLNDRHGHAVGDEVLQSLAAKATAVLPDDGHLIRLGGDEFAALVPAGHDPRRAARVAETLRLVARDETRCTISVGLARMEGEAADLAATFERADRMLYRAKAAGRDRVAA